MPSTCNFEFDRPDPVYFSGETINARIELRTTSPKAVREVYILFEGMAKVHWKVHRSRRQGNQTIPYSQTYRASETYLNTRTTVFHVGTLPPGKHAYTFSTQLPPQCPTSCVEKHGKISYEIKLVLDRPYRFNNVFVKPLTVIRPLDLNMHPELLIPMKNENIKYFCWWPCTSGPVTSTLTIPFGGYAPGQLIKCAIEINNQSTGYDLEDGVELKLKQSYVFTAHTPRRKTRTIVNTLATSKESMRCLRLSKRIIEGMFRIPPAPPTLENEGIISISYYIQMIINTGGCHRDAEIEIPIKIGTIPLTQSATVPRHTISILPTAPETPGSPPSYDQYKPPSFEEATTNSGKFIDIDVDEHNRVDDFIPKYPMFTNFTVPTAPAEPNEATSSSSLLDGTTHQVPSPYPLDDNAMPQRPSAARYGWPSKY